MLKKSCSLKQDSRANHEYGECYKHCPGFLCKWISQQSYTLSSLMSIDCALIIIVLRKGRNGSISKENSFKSCGETNQSNHAARMKRERERKDPPHILSHPDEKAHSCAHIQCVISLRTACRILWSTKTSLVD